MKVPLFEYDEKADEITVDFHAGTRRVELYVNANEIDRLRAENEQLQKEIQNCCQALNDEERENERLMKIMQDAFDEAGQPEFAEWDEIRDALRGDPRSHGDRTMTNADLIAVITRDDWYGNDRLSSAVGPDAAESLEMYCAMIRYHLIHYVRESDPEMRALYAQRLGEDLIAQALEWIDVQQP